MTWFQILSSKERIVDKDGYPQPVFFRLFQSLISQVVYFGTGGPVIPQGAAGIMFDGEEGPEGFPVLGPAGPMGLMGPQGAQGLDGEEGPEGFIVPPVAGPAGPTGPQGPSGIDGEEGPEGFAVPGPIGPTGPAGPQGPAGPAGVVMDGEEGPEGFPIAFVQPMALGANSTKTIAAPAAANSTAVYTMQGLAGSITPRRTGNILVSIAGTVTAAGAATVDNGVFIQGSYGTGAAPGSNAALTGTQAGAVQEYTWPVAPTALADVNYGFNVVFLIPSAQLGVTLWLDLAAKAVTTVSDAPLVNVVITAVEL